MPFRQRSPFTAVVLTITCLMILSLPASCAPKLAPEPAWEKDVRGQLEQAESLYARKQYDQSLRTVESVVYQHPTSRYRDHALYLMGDIRLTQRDYTKALNFFKELLQEFPSSPYFVQSRLKLGQCYFELKDYDLAIANLEDRSKITDPAQLRRAAEMLATAYLAKKNNAAAVRELAYLADTSQNEKQMAGYRDRIRELVDRVLTQEELASLAEGSVYPSDLAQLRLAALLIEQRRFGDAVTICKTFLEKFPLHAERMRGEMLLNEATSKMTAPRYFLGALLPQTGQLAFFGDRVLKGIQLAVHAYNLKQPDNRVELVIRDTQGSPDKAVAGMTELAAKGVVAVIGPLKTREAEALAPLLEKMKIPAITPAAPGEWPSRPAPWLFRNALTNAVQAAEAVQFAQRMNLRKFVIFHPEDASGKDLVRLFTRDLERKAEILATVSYPVDVKDFGPYIRKVMEIDLRSRKIMIPEDDAERKKLLQDYTPSFDALYLPGQAEKVGLLIPQLAFYNIKDVMMIGSNTWHSPDLLERADRHAEGAVFIDGFFPESTDPVIKPVMDAYRSAYQEDPDILAAQAYDAAMLVLTLLMDRKDTPQAVRDGLLATKDYPGISGTITFSNTGDAQKKLFIISVRDGKFVPYSSGK